VLNVLAAAVGMAPPWLLGKIVDLVQDGVAASAVDRVGIGIMTFAVTQIVLTRFARLASCRFGERVLARLREDFVAGPLALPASVVERSGNGDLMTRSSTDVATVGNTLRDALPEVLIAALQAVFIFAAVFLSSPLLGVCASVGVPIFCLTVRWYLRHARTAYLAEAAANSEMLASLAATVEGAQTVDALRLETARVESGNEA